MSSLNAQWLALWDLSNMQTLEEKAPCAWDDQFHQQHIPGYIQDSLPAWHHATSLVFFVTHGCSCHQDMAPQRRDHADQRGRVVHSLCFEPCREVGRHNAFIVAERKPSAALLLRNL